MRTDEEVLGDLERWAEGDSNDQEIDGLQALVHELLGDRHALVNVGRKAADDLEEMVADNKRGPEYGWTGEGEQVDVLQRHAMFVVGDLRNAVGPSRGALARAEAMLAGHPEWWKVTSWPEEPTDG